MDAIAHLGENINTCRALVTGPEVKKKVFAIPTRKGRILLKWILNKMMGRRGLNRALGRESSDLCKCCNEPLGSKKCREFLD